MMGKVLPEFFPAILAIALLWSSYYALHSILASTVVKRYVQGHYPGWWRWYRVGYNVIAVVGLALVWWLYRQLELRYLLWEPTAGHAYAAAVLMLTGGSIVLWSFRGYRVREFVGLDHLQTSATANTLHTEGLNRVVRHPIYLGTLLLFWGYWLSGGSLKFLVVCIVTTLYLMIGARLEERKLVQEFGQAYRDYQQRVKMLIPFIL